SLLSEERRTRQGQVGPGRHQPGATRRFLSSLAKHAYQRGGEAATSAVAADRDMCCRDPLAAQKVPCRKRIVERRREWMFRRQPVADGKRAHSCGPPDLGYHAAAAANRASAVTPPVAEHNDTH